MRSIAAGFIAVLLCLAASVAWAADPSELRKLRAPAPAIAVPLDRAAPLLRLKFVRVVVELPPEPWAYYRAYQAGVGMRERYLSWQDGDQEVDPSTIALIFSDEMRAAHVPAEERGSLFGNESAADLQVGVRIVEMKANLCLGCALAMDRWTGVVTMSAKWELYSPLDRRVVATVETTGGYGAPKSGLPGSADQLVNGAFRDTVRQLINNEEFRNAVVRRTVVATAPSALSPISLTVEGGPRPIPEAAKAVVTVFANEGSGSGFLVSRDGYILTNRHVVGGSRFVKVRWPDGTESLGEVVRSDSRRDVALIKAEARQQQPLGFRSSAVLQGDVVFAVGTPLDAKLQNTVTRGIVSAMRTLDGLSYIQSDVAVNPGNSGGPLLDEKGLVVGVAVSGVRISDAPTGLNFFIPIDDALSALALRPAP